MDIGKGAMGGGADPAPRRSLKAEDGAPAVLVRSELLCKSGIGMFLTTLGRS